MIKDIEINGIKLTYDVSELLKRTERLEADEWDFDDNEDEERDSDDLDTKIRGGFGMTSEEFKISKDSFLEEISKLTNGKYLIDLFKRNTHITKKGDLAKNRNHTILESDLNLNYSCEYGSHSYDVPSICVSSIGDRKAELIFREVSQQSSF